MKYLTWKCMNCISIFNYAERKLDRILDRQFMYCPKCKCKTTHTKLMDSDYGQTISK